MGRKTSDELCPECGRPIEYIKPTELTGWIKRTCDCVYEKREEEIQKAAVKAREYVRTHCGIPKMYLDKTFDNYIPRNDDERKLKQWGIEFAEKKFDNTGIWFIILGGCGVGKTHISTAIMNKTVDTMEISEQVARCFINGYTDNVALPCRYVRCTDLIESELYRMRNNSGTDYEAICKYTPLLVLDDFGVTKATDWNRELFYRILDYRYINELPTVLSTNMTADELNQQLAKISEVRDGKEHFLSCVRSFAEMNKVTPMILQELIDKIEVHAVEGTGLNRIQSVVIHYKFIGKLDMPENFDKIKVNTRKGVEVEYLRTTKTA